MKKTILAAILFTLTFIIAKNVTAIVQINKMTATVLENPCNQCLKYCK